MNQRVYDLVVGDSIADPIKTELVALCAGCPSEAELASAFDRYCETKKLLGKQIVLGKDEVLGTLRTLRQMADRLAKILNVDFSDVKKHLENIAGNGSSFERDISLDWFATEISSHSPALPISRSPCWLFRTDHASADARIEYQADAVQCLACRLGLPNLLVTARYPSGIEFIGCSIASSLLVEVRAPTFLDAGHDFARDIWEVGGRTQPIPNAPVECVKKGGLLEVVAKSPTYADLMLSFHFVRS